MSDRYVPMLELMMSSMIWMWLICAFCFTALPLRWLVICAWSLAHFRSCPSFWDVD